MVTVHHSDRAGADDLTPPHPPPRGPEFPATGMASITAKPQREEGRDVPRENRLCHQLNGTGNRRQVKAIDASCIYCPISQMRNPELL